MTRKLVTVLSLCVLLLCITIQSYAGYSPVGVSACKSYVDTKNSKQIIICVGDSRTMQYTFGGVNSAVRKNFAFCYVNGGNIGVISRGGGRLTSKLTKYIKRYNKYKPVVVFNLGVNGNGKPTKNAKRLISVYNKWMKAYPKIKFFVQSIGPTGIHKGSYSNSNVIKVNKILKDIYEKKGIYIDTYSYLIKSGAVTTNGKGTRDNLHYKSSISEMILKKVRKEVEKNILETEKVFKVAESK